MPYITAKRKTFVKLSDDMSFRLDDSQKCLIAPGQILAVVSCERNGNHSKIRFSGELTIGGKPVKEAWIFTPDEVELQHWAGLEVFRQAAIAVDNYYSPKGSSDFIIPVPYQSQIGNDESLFGPDYRQCMMTVISEAIRVILGEQAVAEAIAAAGVIEWEDVYGAVLAQFGDTTVADAHIQALAFMGIDAEMHYDGTPEKIRELLRKRVPVPGGWKWSTDGHYRLFVGFGDDGSFIVDDPYGKYDPATNSYTKIGPYGCRLRFTADDIQRYWNDLGPGKGWYLEIKAKPHISAAQSPTAKPASGISVWIEDAVRAMANPKLSEAKIRELIEACEEWLPKYGINTRKRLVHFFAQCGHESAGFYSLREWGDYEYFESNYGIAVRDDLGNEVVGDGARYCGRGIGMVTGLANYAVVKAVTGIDYVNQPELMEQYPGALVSFLVWWETNRMNELCDRGLDDVHVNAVGGRVNGANPPNNANDRLNRSDQLKLLIV
jgi:putative chitinase